MGNGVTASKRRTVWLRDGMRCHYCNVDLALEDCTADHVWPRSLGGVNANSNLVACCGSCNCRLADRTDKCPCAFCREAIRSQGHSEERVPTIPPAPITVAELAGWTRVDGNWVNAS